MMAVLLAASFCTNRKLWQFIQKGWRRWAFFWDKVIITVGPVTTPRAHGAAVA